MRWTAAAAPSLAACSPPGPTRPPAPPPPPSPSPIGDWRVLAVNGQAREGYLSIKPPIIGAGFGCNSGNGNGKVEGNRLILTVPMAVTERGCVNPDGSPSEVMRHEAEGFRIVARGGQFEFYAGGRARLLNEAGNIDLIQK